MGKIARRAGLAECVQTYVKPGCELAIGGLHFHNTPMALVREIIRQRVAIERLVPPVDGSVNADQLIGAGLVEEVHTAYVGLEHIGMAPRFRAAVEGGSLRVRETEEGGMVLGLLAGAAGQPFAALPEHFLPEPNGVPNVLSTNTGDYAAVEDPFTGRRHIVARAIRPDVAILHAQVVDSRGNCGLLGGAFLDVEIAKAAEHVVVLVEEEVDELPAGCRAQIPGFIVDAYCVLPGGAHPGSSHTRYGADEDHIRDYAALARSDTGYDAYVRDTIGASEAVYRENAGVDQRIAELASGVVA